MSSSTTSRDGGADSSGTVSRPFSPATPPRYTSNLRHEVGSPTSSVDGASLAGYPMGALAARLGQNAGAGMSSLSLASYANAGASTPGAALTGFNAISTVLNNPTKRPQPIDPKSSRYPPISSSPAELPKVKRADYDAYLESVRPEWDRFVRNQRLGREGKARLVDDPEATAEGQGQGGEGSSGSLQDGSEEGRVRGRKKLPPLSAVPQVFFGEEFNLGNPYTFDLVTERYKSGVTSPGAGQGGELSGYDVALNAMLQEKLSYYSDVVEQHLILEISARSTSFFAALGNLQDLSAEASGCLSRIYELREELRKVDEGQAKKGLRIVQAQSRRRGIRETERAVQAVRELVERREMVRLLVQQGEYEEALDLMDDIRSVLDSRPDVEEHEGGDMFSGAANGAEVAPALRLPSTVLEDGDEDRSGESSHDRGLYIDLTSVKSITSMRPQLVELSESIATSLQQELLSILSADITDRIERPSDDAEPKPEPTASAASGTGADSLSAPRSETDNPASPVSPTARPPASPFGNVARPLSQRDKVLRARIAPLLVGLVRTGGAERALSAYRDVALTAARGVLRTHVPAELQLAPLLEDDDAKAEQRAPATVERLRSIEHAQFLELAQKLFDVLLACIVAVDAHGKLILRALDEHNAQLLITGPTSHSSDDASNGAGPVAPIMPPGVPASLPATLADIVHSTAELAHARASRLLALRSAQHAALDLPSFLGLFQLCWSFVLRSELICRRMIVGLRGAALGQAKGFLAGFHRVRIEAAAKAVEEETWAQAEVPEPTQTEVARIVESAVEDPPAFIVVASSAEGSADSLGGARGDKVDSMARTLEIEGRNYFVVAASLHVLRLLGEYLRVVVNLPLLTTEAMGRVIEFLKQFNSRTCQVVLGAGAMRSAGLKNITAKHLALASQSLSIMITLIPYIRETVRRHLSPKQAVMLTEFDKLRRDYQEHQYEIHAKLVAIMSDRLTVHCRALNAVDWNSPRPESGVIEANKYMADLVKETATLHKVLSKYLQSHVVEHVMGQVLNAIEKRMSVELARVDVKKPEARERLLEDVAFLGRKMTALKNVEWKGEVLDAAIKDKHPPPPEPAPPAPTPAPQQSTATLQAPAQEQPAYKPRVPSFGFGRKQQQAQPAAAAAAATNTDASAPSTAAVSAQSQDEAASAIDTPSVPEKDTPALRVANGTAETAPMTPRTSVEVKDSTSPPPTPAKEVPQKATPMVNEPSVPETAPRDGEASEAQAPRASSESGPLSVALPGEIATESKDEEPAKPAEVAISSDPAGNTTSTEDGPAIESASQVASAESSNAEPSTVPEPTGTRETSAAPESEARASQDSASKADAGNAKPVQDDAASPVTSPATVAAPTSSPASPTTAASPAATPTKPGRMSLQQRLAEAARKRTLKSATAGSGSGSGKAAGAGASSAGSDSSAAPSPRGSVDVDSASRGQQLPATNGTSKVAEEADSTPVVSRKMDAEKEPEAENVPEAEKEQERTEPQADAPAEQSEPMLVEQISEGQGSKSSSEAQPGPESEVNDTSAAVPESEPATETTATADEELGGAAQPVPSEAADERQEVAAEPTLTDAEPTTDGAVAEAPVEKVPQDAETVEETPKGSEGVEPAPSTDDAGETAGAHADEGATHAGDASKEQPTSASKEEEQPAEPVDEADVTIETASGEPAVGSSESATEVAAETTAVADGERQEAKIDEVPSSDAAHSGPENADVQVSEDGGKQSSTDGADTKSEVPTEKDDEGGVDETEEANGGNGAAAEAQS